MLNIDAIRPHLITVSRVERYMLLSFSPRRYFYFAPSASLSLSRVTLVCLRDAIHTVAWLQSLPVYTCTLNRDFYEAYTGTSISLLFLLAYIQCINTHANTLILINQDVCATGHYSINHSNAGNKILLINAKTDVKQPCLHRWIYTRYTFFN